MRIVSVVVLPVLLVACGGGGGSGAGTTYSVTATAQSGGSITPGNATVQAGGTASFSVAPASGFAIDTVTGCGGTLSGVTYTTASATANCAVTASFVALDFHVQVTGNAVGGLVLDNNATEQLAVDSDGVFTFSHGIDVGASYAVHVVQQPVAQVCRAVNAQGVITRAAVTVTVRCVNRIVESLQITLRTSLDAAGEFKQFLYVRSPQTDLHQFLVRSADGGLDEVGPVWRVSSFIENFVFSANGARAFADDYFGDISMATVRDSDGVLVPAWTSVFGKYVPALPVPPDPVRPSPDGRVLYRNFANPSIGGFRYRDLWVGAVSDTGVDTLAGSPFEGSDGGGPNLDPSGRYLANLVRLTGVIEIYPAYTSATQTPVLLSSTSSAGLGAVVFAESSPGTYLYEATRVSESGTTTGQIPRIAVHTWHPDGSLQILGGVLSGEVLTGEIASQVCLSGPSTDRVSVLVPLPATAGSSRILVQRQDTSCFGGTILGIADSRVLGVYRLTVAAGQAVLARMPLDSFAGWTDLGGGGAQHPTKPWLYLGSKHAQRVYAYSVDETTGAVQPLAGSPFDGQTVPPAGAPAVPAVLMDPLGRYLYMTRYGLTDGTTYVDAFSIDQATGALTAVATYLL